MMTPEEAAAITDPAQLPDHLRGPARRLLAALGKSMATKGYSPRQISRDVGLILLKLAYFEPDECPSLAAYEASGASGGWPWDSNLDRRVAIFDARGYGAAYDLWRARHGGGLPPA